MCPTTTTRFPRSSWRSSSASRPAWTGASSATAGARPAEAGSSWPAKGRGGGFPIGASLAKEHCAVLALGEHGTTFGGNPLATHVGYTVLKHIVDHDIPTQGAKRGGYRERR